MTINKQLNQNQLYWQKFFEEMNFPAMALYELKLAEVPKDKMHSLRHEFRRTRKDFIKYIAYNLETECLDSGLPPQDIEKLKLGIAPENFNVHIKIPFEYGGDAEFSNMCFIQTHPYHSEIHKFIDMQILEQNEKIKLDLLYLPIPFGKVYVPYVGSFDSGGGKSMQDRSVYAGFTAGYFKQVAVRSALGRSGH